MHVLIGPNLAHMEDRLPDLRAAFPQVTSSYCSNPAELAQAAAEADVLFGYPTREVLRAARKLKWVQSPASGVDTFLVLPELAEGDVILTSARGTHANSLGDATLGMILALTRGLAVSRDAQREHRWAGPQIRPTVIELAGSTLGIFGLGAAGRAIAQRAHAFEMRLIAVDLYPVSAPDYVEWVRGLDALPQLLAESDFVVVTVPLTQATRSMLGAAQLAQMKAGAYLVNISRGGIIDEAALAAAVRSGRLAGAALDVYAEEPLPPSSELWDLPNVLLTPHIAGATQSEGHYLYEIFTENLGRYLRGEFPLRNQVDKQRGF
jgi:phosphoglycerate dehydrogenase-like enzyme